MFSFLKWLRSKRRKRDCKYCESLEPSDKLMSKMSGPEVASYITELIKKRRRKNKRKPR